MENKCGETKKLHENKHFPSSMNLQSLILIVSGSRANKERKAKAEPAFFGLFAELFHAIKASFTWSALWSEHHRTVWHDKSPLNDLLIVTMIVNFLEEPAAEAPTLNQDLQNPPAHGFKSRNNLFLAFSWSDINFSLVIPASDFRTCRFNKVSIESDIKYLLSVG